MHRQCEEITNRPALLARFPPAQRDTKKDPPGAPAVPVPPADRFVGSLHPPCPAAAPPCSRRTGSTPSPVPQAQVGSCVGGDVSRRRHLLVAGRKHPGDGGTSTILQRYFCREPRRSVMGSRRVIFLPFSPRVKVIVGLILQRKSYPSSSCSYLCPLYV